MRIGHITVPKSMPMDITKEGMALMKLPPEPKTLYKVKKPVDRDTMPMVMEGPRTSIMGVVSPEGGAGGASMVNLAVSTSLLKRGER